jgi:hypothetical protein
MRSISWNVEKHCEVVKARKVESGSPQARRLDILEYASYFSPSAPKRSKVDFEP